MKKALFFSLIVLFLSSCVAAQQASNLDKRVTSLERKTFDISKTMDAKGEGFEAKAQFATYQAELDKLREEINSLRGKVEETEFLATQNTTILNDYSKKTDNEILRLDSLNAVNQSKITILEKALNVKSKLSQQGAQPTSVARASAGNNLSDKELYDLAYGLFKEGDYENAKHQFSDFLQKYPASDYADNVQYWLGETYYRTGDYKQSILEYQKVIKLYPEGNKVPAAMLKQGFAFIELGEKANAKLILEELIRQFANSSEAEIAQRKLKFVE